ELCPSKVATFLLVEIFFFVLFSQPKSNFDTKIMRSEKWDFLYYYSMALIIFSARVAFIICDEPQNGTKLIYKSRDVLMDFKYEKNFKKSPTGVDVTLEIHVQDLSSIYEPTADFELDLMYSEIWFDPRLIFNNYSICLTNLTLKSHTRNRLWTPDTCIINSKKAEIHKSPSENTFVIIYD
uniref:Neurotransmitter-gated ion-channel ligand-binding domain-containing protein n=1 Tax=Romanomermis culicivorax TaxID=13658 RepID=A0A915I505_ROMCU